MNTHEKLKQIIILYDKGYSITKLKNMFHISDTTISKYLKENNRIVKNKEYYNNLLLKSTASKEIEDKLWIFSSEEEILEEYYKKITPKIPENWNPKIY